MFIDNLLAVVPMTCIDVCASDTHVMWLHNFLLIVNDFLFVSSSHACNLIFFLSYHAHCFPRAFNNRLSAINSAMIRYWPFYIALPSHVHITPTKAGPAAETSVLYKTIFPTCLIFLNYIYIYILK